MAEKDSSLIWEFLLTFLLLFLAILIVSSALPQYRLYSALGLIIGFYFSWFNRNKQFTFIRYGINICSILIFVWLIYSLLNSTFRYKEVILIFVKAGIFLEIILSFNCLSPSSLSYIRILSVPLFMCPPIFIKNYSEAQAILVFLYIICWIVILKLKFYMLTKFERPRKFIWRYSPHLLIAFFLMSIFVSWALFSRLTLGKLIRGGIFPLEGKGLQVREDASEKGYYDLQAKIQEEITKLIPKFKFTEERQELLYLLNLLIKELPDVIELKKAYDGLISLLKRKGPGLEKEEAQNLVILIKNYLDNKTALNIRIIKKSITDILKENNFSIQERISILSRINRMQNSDSYQQIQRYEGELQEIINKSSVDTKIKINLKKSIKQFKEWKDYEIYLRDKDSSMKKFEPLEQSKKESTDPQPLTVRVEEPKLVSVNFSPQNTKVSLKGSLDLKAQGSFSDSSQKDITSLVSWKVNNNRIINIEKGKIQPLKIGKTQVYAEYLGIKSPPVNITVTVTMVWLISLIFMVISFLILGIVFILWFLRENEKSKLRTLLDKNPRRFIVSLYENIKKILAIFGLDYKEFMPPLSYAKLVENRYSIEDSLFLGLTWKFEEAKYSQHVLAVHNAILFLSNYNNFLKILFSRYNKARLLLKYSLALLQRRPLVI